MKRMFPIMESDVNQSGTPGTALMKEVDWCAEAMSSSKTQLCEGAMQNKIMSTLNALGEKYALDADVEKSFSNAGVLTYRKGLDAPVAAVRFDFQNDYASITVYRGAAARGGNVAKEYSYLEYSKSNLLQDMLNTVEGLLKAASPAKSAKAKPSVSRSANLHNTFQLAEGTRPVVEDLIETLQELMDNAEDELDDASAAAAIKAYQNDMKVLKSIVNKLSVV